MNNACLHLLCGQTKYLRSEWTALPTKDKCGGTSLLGLEATHGLSIKDSLRRRFRGLMRDSPGRAKNTRVVLGVRHPVEHLITTSDVDLLAKSRSVLDSWKERYAMVSRRAAYLKGSYKKHPHGGFPFTHNYMFSG